MDNIRLILFFALAFILLALYQAWQDDYGAAPVTSTPQQQAPATPSAPAADGAVPVAPANNEGVPAAPGGAIPSRPQTADADRIRVTTDEFYMEIDTRGGTVSKVELQQYPLDIDAPERKLTLFEPAPPRLHIAQSGLIGADPALAPTHEAVFRAEQTEYRMPDGQDSLRVTLTWAHPSGVEVRKHFDFRRGSYEVAVDHEVLNSTDQPWSGRRYGQLQRMEVAEEGQSSFVYTYMGGAYYTPDKKYQKYSFDDMKEQALNKDVAGGWIAMLQHYFVSAWVPPSEETDHFYSKVLGGDRYVIGSYSPSVTVAAGSTHVFPSTLYVGPKLQSELEQVAPGLDLTRDYGWLAVIAQPMFWIIAQIHNVVGNWGWAIIIFTILLKLVLFPLSATSYKSMAGMRKLGPRIQALKDRYGDDKQRMQQAMMEMYRKEKINPLGGCLPIVVQIPFFIALYWVLLESVELRQAPWILWIRDLSVKDPYFVLPLLMGISMFVQQKLNPQPPDPMQAKIMMSMPFIFTVFFAFFPSGLVLYWLVNNLFSIGQQWYITRKIEQAGT
jgi:YidC/Oxa1 family membrane protein insertase